MESEDQWLRGCGTLSELPREFLYIEEAIDHSCGAQSSASATLGCVLRSSQS